jgi:hypothetical protein
MKPWDMSIGARELRLFVENNEKLIKQSMLWFRNFATKKARKTYNKDLAIKGFMHFAKRAAQAYCKDQGEPPASWNKLFSMSDRQDFARFYEELFRSEYAALRFESILPAKYQKKATRKATQEAFGKLAKRE